jgi:hypothetical protein
MKRLIFAMAFVAASVWAQPDDRTTRVAHMAQECRAVMAKGLCVVKNSSPLPPEARATKWRLGFGLGTVSTGAYMDVQEAGDRMCDLIERACADWDGEQCRVIRSLWRQQ